VRLGWGGGVVYRRVGGKRWCEAEREGGVLGACEKLPWFLKAKTVVYLYRALELFGGRAGC
jgi:hypothetical protein